MRTTNEYEQANKNEVDVHIKANLFDFANSEQVFIFCYKCGNLE